MKLEKSKKKIPFWDDSPYEGTDRSSGLVKLYVGLYGGQLIFIVLVIIFSVLVNTQSTQYAQYFFILFLFVVLFVLFSWIGTRHPSGIKEIQQKALEDTRALLIGSAIHTAGHPTLDCDQKIVIALKKDCLEIYKYDSAIPIVTIDIKEIGEIKTIIYDDDRVPHSDVVDSAAQALQVEFYIGDKKHYCVFRSMRKVRPIDWYQAIKKAQHMGQG